MTEDVSNDILGRILDPKMVQNRFKIDPIFDHDSKTEKVLHDIHGTRSLLAPLGATVVREINPEAVQNRFSSDLESDIETKSFLRPIFAEILIGFQAVIGQAIIRGHATFSATSVFMV